MAVSSELIQRAKKKEEAREIKKVFSSGTTDDVPLKSLKEGPLADTFHSKKRITCGAS